MLLAVFSRKCLNALETGALEDGCYPQWLLVIRYRTLCKFQNFKVPVTKHQNLPSLTILFFYISTLIALI